MEFETGGFELFKKQNGDSSLFDTSYKSK